MHQHRAPPQSDGQQDTVWHQKTLYHRGMDGFEFQFRVGLDRYRIGLVGAENLHLRPAAHILPARMRAERMVYLLVLGRPRIKVGRFGIIGNGKLQFFRLNAAIDPAKAGHAIDHPALGGHFLQMPLDARAIIKGQRFHSAFGLSHHGASFPKARS